MSYRAGDIRDKQISIDIQKTRLPTDSIDVLFACHVLNMVRDDQVAMAEIKRILQPKGVAVLPVPLLPHDKVMMEVSPESKMDERFAVFQDPLMFRAYTDEVYQTRLQASGFEVLNYHPRDVRSDDSRIWQLGDECLQVARSNV